MMMKTFIQLESHLLILLSVWGTNLVNSYCRECIMTSSGQIKGTEMDFYDHKVKQYLGVPFAEPPVGELRFKKPLSVQKHSEIILANKMPPACIQYMEYPFPWYDFQDGKSEDCLYLNIWVPQISRNDIHSLKIPVMVWIYGGGFTVGSNRNSTYEGFVLAAIGKIIVVTINYRMGAFGFLTSGTEAAPGNVGMHDILEALRWVNKNIGAFGGDSDQVTIAGQSSGSIAISLLCVSPLAKGLFHRVIMESGSAAYLLAENNSSSIDLSQKLAKEVGCANEKTTISTDPDEVVNCLRKKDAFELAETLTSFNPTSARSFFPSYNDDILPENARTALIEGKFHNVDVLIGNTRDEGSFQMTTSHPEDFGFFGNKSFSVNISYAETLLEGIFNNFPDPKPVINHYLGNVSNDDYDRIRYQVYAASGDFSLLCPTKYFAESYSRAGNKVFYYFFVHQPNPSVTPWAQWMGATHFSEVQFVFGVPLKKPSYYTPSEVNLSKDMLEIWTTFVKDGNPGEKNWPSYSRENSTYYRLGTNIRNKTRTGPHESNCDFFRNYFKFF